MHCKKCHPDVTLGESDSSNLLDAPISGLGLLQGTNLNYAPYVNELRTCFVSEIKRRQLLLFFILLFSLCCFHVSQNTLTFNLRFALKMFSCAITLFSNM